MKGPLFYSKILLFGEYGIIKDSKGLSIPYSFYNGALKMDENPNQLAIESNLNLKKFVQYLSKIDANLVSFELEQLQQDINAGMYFDSSIPQGYGVGSSGALETFFCDAGCLGRVPGLPQGVKPPFNGKVKMGPIFDLPPPLRFAPCLRNWHD